MSNWYMSADDILGKLRAAPEGKQSFYPFQHGTLRAGVYSPKSHDTQEPHGQDELYVVIRGTGYFAKGGERRAFKPGDAIFVEAGAEHAFTDFSDDFATWVIFWGPEGGQK
jgi:mannose-6-phosphate isomerase-like protein (cupin superfamily)